MSYLAVDLDAKKRAVKVARASGVSPGDVLWGLTEVWEHVFLTGKEVLTQGEMAGCFGTAASMQPLVDFEFLELVEGGFRVCGAGRYLNVKKARKEAAERTNSLKKAPPLTVCENDGDREGASNPRPQKTVSERSTVRSTVRSKDALTPNTEHRTPKETTIVEEAENAAQCVEPPPSAPPPRETSPIVPVEPTTPIGQWTGEDFWRWAQFKRCQAGLVAERGPPVGVNRWHSSVMMELNGDGEALKEAFFRFGDDKYWQKATPKLPFNAFKAKWSDYSPQRSAHAATS